jgi:dihydropyrimidine dehydrogenase (NAD+) subunit PreT
VDEALMKAPIAIGRLQRFACDAATDRGVRFFEAGPPTGYRVAIVGSGPAGLSCAHELRRLGHDVVVFEARDIPGGLDTLGIASYKVTAEFALEEIGRICSIGIDLRLDHQVTVDELLRLLSEYDAVFLGVGLGRTAMPGIEGEDLPGVWEALDFIFQTHTHPFEACEVGRHVLVIGGGNTAIDVATAAHRLGAETVMIAYRRGEAAMPAFAYEYELAKAGGVQFEWEALPLRVVAREGSAAGVEFARIDHAGSTSRRGMLRPLPGSEFIIEADMVVMALGHEPLLELLAAIPGLEHDRGRVKVVAATGATTVPKLFAGGDCLRNGGEVVDAVADGKRAALGIHASFGG